ncbi:MAG: methyltransferase [Bacteriovorax sp.]|nr:methyltransferase [Bacteriovorax sp.]
MIKNNIYTYDYFQPDEYRFSLDSVFLAQKVATLLENKTNLESWKVLDLCSGCGIIGLELSLHRPELLHFDFLEIQNLYFPFFQKNVEMICSDTQNKHMHFLNHNYQVLLGNAFEDSYDLIVSNPPYFFKGEGLLSPNDFKNRCRFFLDSDFKTLIEAITNSLRPNASAYLLMRKGDHHGRSALKEINRILKGRASAQIIDNIRGTEIVHIEKKLL